MLIESFEKYFLSAYREREGEAFFQARVLLIMHMFLIILMLVIIALGFSDSGMIPFLKSIIILSIISLVFLRYGKLTTVTLITYIATGLFASLIVFNRLSYNIYETYMLATIHMSITVVASLLTNQRRYTLVTTGLGVIYIILLYFFRGVPLSSSTHPLEIDDYLVVIALLIMTGLIVTSTVTRRRRLLEMAKAESAQSITKGKQIKQSEERYQTLVESLNEGIGRVDENEIFTLVNQAAADMFGYSKDEMIGKNLRELVSPESYDQIIQQTAKRKEGASSKYELKIEREEGIHRLIAVSATPMNSEKGAFLGTFGIFHDITERKRAENIIEQQQYYLEKAQEMGNIGTWELDLLDNQLTWTDENYRIFGVSLGTPMTHEIFLGQIHEDDRDYVNDEWAKALAGTPYDIEHRLVVDGKIKWVREKAIVEFDMDGKAVSGIGFTQDITERKRAEEELQESENKFKSIFENKGTATGIFGEDSILIDCNAMLADIVGYSKHEILDKMKWSDLVVKEDLIRLQKYHSQRLESGDPPPSQYECSIIKKSGEFVNVIVNLALIGEKRKVSLTNITERKQAETALKDSEKLLRVIAKNLPNLYLSIIEKDFTIGFTSGGGFTERGLDPDDFMGLHIKQIFGEHEPEVKKYFEETFLGNEQNFELFNDNEYQAYQTIPLYDKGGNISRILSVAQNVTERKLAEEALKRSKNRATALLSAIPDLMFRLNDEGVYLDYKADESVLYVTDSKSIIGKRNRDLTPPAFSNLVDEKISETLTSVEMQTFEYNLIVPEVGRRDYEARMVKSGDDEVIAIVRDISERKQAETSLAESEEHYRTLFENMLDGFALHKIVVDKNNTPIDYIFLEINDAFEKQTGLKRDDIIGRNATEVIPGIENDPADWIGTYGKTALAGGELRFEQFSESLDKWYSVLAFCPQANHFATIFTDITERKQAAAVQKSLENQIHQAHKLEAVGTMVGGISHELNNILQGMFLYSGLIEEQLPDDKDLKDNFKQLQNGAEKARDIVKQILTFSRKTAVDMKPQPIHELIMEAIALERASIPANIEIKQDIDMNCGMVLCDKTQIHQIVMNLGNNAQHAMEKAGGILSVSLQNTHKTIRNGDPAIKVLELIIRDTGHGIDPADLESIFDPFFTTKQFGQGTGLGLSVIHGIVEMMGGDISVTSEFAKGTTFSILFPVVDGVEAIHTTPKAIAPNNDFNMSILLVDDDTSIREVTQAILIRKGFAVESASDGQKAFDLFKANPNKYNLIVTDLSMPIMSGIELCQAIRASGSDIPIMLSTGHLDIEDQKEYENIGITKSIQKPWTADELIARIHKTDKR